MKRKTIGLAWLLAVLLTLSTACSQKPNGGGETDDKLPAESGSQITMPEPDSETSAEKDPETDAPVESTPKAVETPAAETEAKPETTAKTETEKPAEPEPPAASFAVTGISLDKYKVNVWIGLSDMPWVTMEPSYATDKSEIWTSDNPAVATVDPYGRIFGVNEGVCHVTVQSKSNPEVSAVVEVVVTAKEKIREATYINGILVVNKTYGLPSSYNPGVDATAQENLDIMFEAAKKDGVELFVNSGFRNYELQTTLYNNYVARDGANEADRYSARPGYSEHQTGMAFDLNSFEQSFGETKEGKWLAEHAWEYGFVIRYPLEKESITGFMYEPWHVRYLGADVAGELHESGQCLEEYLGISSVYPGTVQQTAQ